tara:strand:+ start:353 stop:652 length:300 start_codon:yes stop_codon:yes gene_type:complete
MPIESIVTIVLSILGALTSTKAWEYWKHRNEMKAEQKLVDQKESNLYRDELRKEVSDLRQRLDSANLKIVELTKRLAEMAVRVEFLERENHTLRGVQAK